MILKIKKIKRSIILIFLSILSISVSAATGKITFLRFEHNKMVNGVKCLSMHFKVEVDGMKGRKINVIAYVEHPKGVGVPDKNGRYKTKDGKVSASADGKATYDSSIWKDFVINLPNDEIHPLPGKNTYYIEALLWDDNHHILARTYCDTFDMTGSTNSGSNRNAGSNNNRTPKRNSGVNEVVETYRQNLNYGYKIVSVYANGSRLEAFYTPCSSCFGSRVCSICSGRGGIITAGYGNYIPCNLCGQTGICSLCRANNGFILSSSQLYDANGKPVYVPPIGGSYSGGSGSSGSGSSGSSGSSSRYGYYDCPTCYGTGTCQTCGGDGIADSYYTGGDMVCPNCRSRRGKCSVCNGTGKKYGVK